MTKTLEPKYDERHGGPYDRGAADFYYGRAFEPHYFEQGTYTSPKVSKDRMSPAELEAYSAGYDAAAADGSRKEW